jgi:transposase-like protein
MAKIENFILSVRQRRTRYFSEEFKRRKVEEIERKLVTISELCREYEVSRTSVHKWIYKYSKMRKKGEVIRLESESDTRKLQEMKERIKELERIVGQKQILIDFQEKVIELAEEEYKVDIKKKYGAKHSAGTGFTEKGIK